MYCRLLDATDNKQIYKQTDVLTKSGIHKSKEKHIYPCLKSQTNGKLITERCTSHIPNSS